MINRQDYSTKTETLSKTWEQLPIRLAKLIHLMLSFHRAAAAAAAAAAAVP
eukprot:CAMPEP_0202371654 /NCGR_PEP_ID=MMETSP1127-20130417/2996_1 /ASSEMBLY_ACC=CAM_ASM_000462 /TAXON_ID=3047 /ORGANISM="Dunaliella tertiolecta, Strain CCMP1320" /LENGTH=50 /DNA_ID=CAMNT_0048967975 /DNA_START=151 /DNA_END=299 /DNA_ORIENTATION=+